MINWTLAPSLVKLREQVNAAYPGRSKVSDGTIGDAAHAATVSDHNPDSGGVVRAFDITNDPKTFDMSAFVNALAASKDSRISYLIWNKRMLRSYPKPGIAPWTWTPYLGIDPHTSHVHVSVVSDAIANSTAPWNFTTAKVNDDMNASEFIALMKEAAERSTPAGRQLGTYLTQAIGANRIEAKVNDLSAESIAAAVVKALPANADAAAIAKAVGDEVSRRLSN